MKIKRLNQVLTLVLTIAALAAEQAAWAMSSFTIDASHNSSTHKTTFTITRTGNTTVAETIDWRVVSLSAIAGQHFTVDEQNGYDGTATFSAGISTASVTISEKSPSDNAYKYQNGTERKYRFEVLDKDGSILATKDRTMTTGTSVPSSGLFNEKEITIFTTGTQFTDAGYDQSNNPHYINSSSYYNLSGIAPAAYYTLIGAQLRSTLSLEAREENNGYQYVQILINNTSTCDNRSKCSDGDPGNISLSRYMAGFDHEPSKANTNYATYTFPVTSQPNNCSEVSNAWSNGVTNKLYTQKFNTNCRATDGRLILPVDFEKFVVRFNASGGGSDHDEWLAKNVKAHIQAVDGTAPTVLSNYKVSGGRHQKGNTIYVSVAFSEIVTVTGTPMLSSNWGTLSYVAGSGSNVLTFKGTIDPSDNNAFGVSGYTLNGGTIKDLAGNSFSGSISHSFGTTLDEDYAWTTSDFNQLETNTYEIYTTLDMRHLALMVNSGNNNCSGLTFKQTHDITYTHTTNWNNSSSQEDNYTAIGTDDHGFQGTFDGQDHTISGIRIYRGDYTSADDYQGLFGYISGGTVRGVNLADARITGFKYVGGIAGKIYSCTVKDCTVAADVCIHAVHGDSDYHGGIVGNSQGTVQRCLSRARLTVTDASDCGYYGAIVGYNNNHAVKDCIAIGASVPSVSNAGAIIGYGNINGAYDVQRNYYRDCTVAGVENATGVGVGYDKNTKSPHDVTANQGAQALYSLTLSSGVTQVRTASATLPGTGNKTYTTGADIDGTPYAFDGAALTFSYTGEAVTTMGYAVLFYKDGTPFEGNSYKMTKSDVSITASATDLWGIADNADGSADHPYHIGTRTALDLLASYVNNGVSEFDSKHFLQTGDITYDVITTYINNVPTVTSNYTAIGYYNDDNDHKAFKGHYNGGGRTITGIQIVKTGHGNSDSYLGLFGYVDGGTIENVVLTQSQIKGNRNIGSIAGYLQNGTIQNCYIGSNVSIVIGNASNAAYQGGVVGQMSSGSCVQGCFCGANINRSDQISTANWYYGGIAGYSLGTIQNNIYTGSFYNYKLDSFGGAIAGDHSGGTLANNYYTSKDVPGGINYTDQDGARRARIVTLGENVALSGDQTEYDVSGLTAIGTKALSYNDGTTTTIYSGATQMLTLNYTGTPVTTTGYAAVFSATAGTVSGNRVVMSDSDVSITVTSTDVWGVTNSPAADGSAEHPYLIGTLNALDLLAKNVNGSDGYTANNFQNKYFLQTANITYDGTENNYTPIGDKDHSFNGHFDGDGNTVSGINIYHTGLNTNTTYGYKGIFGNVDGGNVHDVVLAESTITSDRNIGGIVGRLQNNGTVQNCRVEGTVTINTGSVQYSNVHGGIVGSNESSSVIGCLSAATLNRNNKNATFYGGIVGYCYNGTVKDCLYIGTTVEATNMKGAIVGDINNGTNTLANNYYTDIDLGGVNGSDQDGARRARTVTLGENIALVGDETVYNVSGLTAIGTGSYALSYNDGTTTTLYSGEGQTLTLTYTGDIAEGYQVIYSATAGTIDGNTLTMPASDVTVSNMFSTTVSYINAEGHADSHEAIVINAKSISIDGDNRGNIGIDNTETWYAVVSDYTFSGSDRLVVHGTVNLILADGATFTVNGNTAGISSYDLYSDLNIFGQSAGTGTLNASHSTDDISSAGIRCGGLTINGATVNATGIDKAGIIIGHPTGSLTINGGTVNATSTGTGDGIGTNVDIPITITGGTVNAIGGNNGASYGIYNDRGSVTITGGNVTAIGGGSYGIYAFTGITLGWTTPSDRIYASSYLTDGGVVSIQNGKTLTDGTNTYSGTLTDEQKAAIAGKTLFVDYTNGHSGDSEADAYIIYNKEQLDALASRINAGGGNDYYQKFIKLGADIAYDGTENNYTPIGNNSGMYSFQGIFDGDGHTVSGININRGNDYQGLFGYVGIGTVKNVTLANSTITANKRVGGIAGHNYGTVQNCRVESTVTINAYADDASNYGGIVGYCDYGTVDGCISSATISHNDKNHCYPFAAIAGNNNRGTIRNCLAIGATVSSTSKKGAIVGLNNYGTLTNNYYYNCTVGGNTTNVGTNEGDLDGARQACTVTLGENIALVGDETAYSLSGLTAIGTGNYALRYNDGNTTTIYSGEGQTLTLSYTGEEVPVGYQLTYSATAGTIDGNTLTMPADDVTVSAAIDAIPWSGSGSEDDPYLIQYPSQLDLLATRVNAGGGSDYYQKFIKLGADIAYDGTENNYTPIGNNSGMYSFKGTFDGDGHTVSGININDNNDYQGLFGYVSNLGTVKNVTLANSTITASNRVGGIAGHNYGTVQNCRVESTVTINAYANNTSNHGGIVGYCHYGTVDGCISSATVSPNDNNHCSTFAAIAGYNNHGTIRNCLAIGATVSSSSNRGAIVGLNNGGTLTSNYYYNCTVGGSTTNVGTRDGDVTENDGAVAATILSESETVPSSLSDKVVFRREFTGGKASTVIFPFAHEKGTEGTYYTFGGVAYDGTEGKWKATMNEYSGATLMANTPYLFVPAGSEAHTPVLFHGTAAATTSAGTTANGDWSFKGIYAQKTWAAGDVGRDYGFAATSGKAVDGITDVEAGDFVKLAAGAWIRPMRAYLTYTGTGNPWAAPKHRAGTELPQSISVILVNANGEVTEVNGVNGVIEVNDNSWYTLDGRKLDKQPTTKGLYINNGKKTMIK